MLALVTGASSGIGLQYATQLARDYHTNLLLVSNQEKELQQVATDLAAQYHVHTIARYADLSRQDAAEELFAYCQAQNLYVDILINDAGVFFFNPYCETSMKRIELMLNLHMVTVAKMTRLFAEQMINHELTDEEKQQKICGKRRKRGYILNMSSMSAWMAMPGIQCYNASKSYVLNFSKSLWYEMRPHHVHVLAMTPGSTNTGLLPFPDKWGRLLRIVGITMLPERLVQRALHVLFCTRRKRCMPGAWNYIIVPIINHLPDWLVNCLMPKIL